MNMLFHWIIASAALLLVACSHSLELPPEDDGSTILTDYYVGVGDSLHINVWRNAELTLTVPVRPDGKISMPLVGDILAAGLTATDLSASIANAVSDYVRNPQVTVIVLNTDSADFQRRIRITGAVNQPQSIPYRDGMTVLDLVLMAGGTNDFASLNNAKLYRKVAGQVQVYPIYLNELLHQGKLATNYALKPSDIVSVPERRL